MMKMLRFLPVLLALSACIRLKSRDEPGPTAPPERVPSEDTGTPSEPPQTPSGAAALPEGFAVEGEPEIAEAYLDPLRAWREVVSRLTTLRADAAARSEDILVTFEAAAVHATTKKGLRRTWSLPEGLRLLGGPRHLLLGADLTTRAYAGDGSQLPLADGLTVVRARAIRADGRVEEFRLVVKEEGTFRSISNAG